MVDLHAPLPRMLTPVVERALSTMPVVVVTGARQTGKSTLVQHLLSERPYLTLDDLETRARARSAPDALLRGQRLVTIDEVQREPELLLAIKKAVDDDRTPGRFVLTGSADLLLMKRVSETLAGRAAHFQLGPMTRREQLGRGGGGPWSALLAAPEAEWLDVLQATEPLPTDWTALARVGGFPTPAVALRDADARALWFGGYTQTYLERDLRDLAAVQSLVDFRRLMASIGLRVGNVLNVTELARDVAQPQATVHRHLDLLEVSFQIVRLPAYAVNRTKRLVKSPKIYGADVGLTMFVAGETEPRGAHLENLLVAELRAWQATQPARPSLMYWRTTQGVEVDLVIEVGVRVFPIEIKATPRPSVRDARALLEFRKEYADRSGPGLLVHTGDELGWIADGVLACPLARLL